MNEVKVSDLIKTLLESTCRYRYAHIHGKKYQQIYLKVMRECMYQCNACFGENPATYLLNLNSLKVNAQDHVRTSIFNNNKHYYMMGLQDAEEIVTYIRKRFVNGGAGSDTTFVNSILEYSGYKA